MASASLAFEKVEGLGNDFILLDRTQAGPEELAAEIERASELASGLCDRRTGVGADGILLVGGPRAGAAASMTVINFDGSRPEMCGNGLRCVAAWVGARVASAQVDIDTDAGLRRCELVEGRPDSPRVSVRIDMGPAKLLGTVSPQAGGGRRFVGVSMGNPHAVCFVGDDEDPETLAHSYGPAIETDPAYQPAKTNVEFAVLEQDGSVVLWVWERGVGITQACGTGACATVAAGVSEGLLPADEPVKVRLPGGTLTITAPKDASASVTMIGPARRVFTGDVLGVLS